MRNLKLQITKFHTLQKDHSQQLSFRMLSKLFSCAKSTTLVVGSSSHKLWVSLEGSLMNSVLAKLWQMCIRIGTVNSNDAWLKWHSQVEKKTILCFSKELNNCACSSESGEKGAKVHLIICTPVPSAATPDLEPLYRKSEDIIGTLLKLRNFRDSSSGIQPSFQGRRWQCWTW